MALPQQYLPALSPEQYLDLERASEMRHEYLDGVMYAMAGESPDHSRICFNLAVITGTQIRNRDCQGFSPNMKVRAGLAELYAYPDLMIVCSEEPRFHDEHGDVLLNPTVIFEVLSPSTERYDPGEKFLRYRTQIDSLQDYVLVAQDKMRIEHFHRQSDGTWTELSVEGTGTALSLDSIECQIALEEVYRNTKAASLL